MQPENSATSKTLLKQAFSITRLKRCLLFAIVPAVLCYGFTIKLLTTSGFTAGQAIRDPAQLTNTSSWLGLVSNLGVLLMVSAAVICLFVYSTKVKTKTTAAGKKQNECLLLMGLLSAFIAIDDFFLLHDRHIGEHSLYIAYAFCLLMLLRRHTATIVKVDGPAFLAAGVLLGLSVLSDVVFTMISQLELLQLIEEGFKFVGMATWLYFSYRMATHTLHTTTVYVAVDGERAVEGR